MNELVEPRVRGLVVEHLGVDGHELTPDVSLVDDLAADSLDLLEIAIAIETQFGITVPESAIDAVRTYADLVELVCAQTQTRARREAEDDDEAQGRLALVWARVVSPRTGAHADLQRAGWLTPYAAQTIAEDALRAGPGARLEMSVPTSVSDDRLARLRDQFAWLSRRGVQVSVRRDHHMGPIGQRGAHRHAAA
jgi:acyl carrier protein